MPTPVPQRLLVETGYVVLAAADDEVVVVDVRAEVVDVEVVVGAGGYR